METCSCLFIDHGDEDTILVGAMLGDQEDNTPAILQKEDLRELNMKFLLVPPQVITVEIAGLQEYQHRYSRLAMVSMFLYLYVI